MPIYEYQCKDCGKVFEAIVSVTSGPPPCEDCQSENTEKQVSAHGGYSMYSGPSSIRPKGAGSFKKRK